MAVGSRVRIVWPSTHDGLSGVVTYIDGTRNRLYVRIDGERWRTLPPILLAREEVVPADTEGSEQAVGKTSERPEGGSRATSSHSGTGSGHHRNALRKRRCTHSET